MTNSIETEPEGLPKEFPAAPIETDPRPVPGDWIDYNGHMNVAYYTLAFDQAFDRLLEDWLGLGEARARTARQGPYVVQSQTHYLGELLEGDPFFVAMRLIDADAKRMHVYSELMKTGSRELCATFEMMVVNVDLDARRSAALPDWAQRKLSALCRAQADLERPRYLGATIGIRRKTD